MANYTDAMSAETTAPKQHGKPFQKGVSGNPAGRPIGAGNKTSLGGGPFRRRGRGPDPKGDRQKQTKVTCSGKIQKVYFRSRGNSQKPERSQARRILFQIVIFLKGKMSCRCALKLALRS